MFELPSGCSSLPGLDLWASLKTVIEDKDLAVNASLPSRRCAHRATLVRLLLLLLTLLRSFENRSSHRVVIKYLDE